MTPTGAELLGRLGSGVRPVGAERTVDPVRAGRADGPAFAALLERARQGEVASGLPVEIEPATGLNLTDEQMRRLESAADAATAQGAERAVVLLDGRALVLDVQSRRVLEAHRVEDVSTLAGIDAVVGAPAPAPSDDAPSLARLAAAPGWLARTLEQDHHP